MALVARGTSIPIATGERLTTKYEFGRVLECRAASILQMALGRVGGIWEAKKIAGMAETYYAQIATSLLGQLKPPPIFISPHRFPISSSSKASKPSAASTQSC
jgi:hypothetical protein